MKITRLSMLAALLLATSLGCGGVTDGGGDGDGDGDGDGGPGDGDVDDFDLYKSGTRLRANIAETPDGAKRFISFRDIMLNIDCNISDVGDGRMFCLPITIAQVIAQFEDAACTQELAITSQQPGCSPTTPTYVRDFQDSCSDTMFAEIGAPISPAQVFQLDIAGACVQGTVVASFNYYRVGTSVPLTTFATANIVTE